MEIRSIRIDFDKNILEINGEPYKENTIVTLPGPDGWSFRKVFNIPDSVGSKEECDRLREQSDLLKVIFTKGN